MNARTTTTPLTTATQIFGGVAAADEKSPQGPTVVCPVSGGPIDLAVSADYRGGKVCFGSAECVPKFRADPAPYAAKANRQLVLTGQARQVACPLTGWQLNPKTLLEVGGIDVAFCSYGCRSVVAKADADQRLELVFGRGFDKAFSVNKKRT